MHEVVNDIKAGAVGVIPTDTIYGLVGSALNPKAVEKIYKIRKRDSKKPCLILISKIKDISRFTSLSKVEGEILKKIWPDKITVVLPIKEKRNIKKFKYLHRGTNTLAFRLPKNKALIDLISKTGPLLAPSANPQGKDPALNILEAKKYFGEKIDFYVSGITSKKPSTLVEIDGKNIEILRPGAISLKTIQNRLKDLKMLK